jgi:hypothetical protein
MGTMLNLRTIRLRAEESNNLKGKVKETVSRASLGCGRLSVGGEVTNHVTILPLGDVIRDSAVQLGLTHQRGAIGVDSSTCLYLKFLTCANL